MNLHQLREFCEVAGARSFTAAAARSGLAQPAASWQVRRLEEAYGLRLLDRIGARISLTEEGGSCGTLPGASCSSSGRPRGHWPQDAQGAPGAPINGLARGGGSGSRSSL